jgi:hypothetical protein
VRELKQNSWFWLGALNPCPASRIGQHLRILK